MNIEIENLSPDKVKIEDGDRGEKIVNYGTITKQTDTNIQLKLITNIRLSENVFSSCGCTTPKLEKDPDGNYILKIKYNNVATVTFNKTVKVRTKDGRQEQVFKIRGQVK